LSPRKAQTPRLDYALLLKRRRNIPPKNMNPEPNINIDVGSGVGVPGVVRLSLSGLVLTAVIPLGVPLVVEP